MQSVSHIPEWPLPNFVLYIYILKFAFEVWYRRQFERFVTLLKLVKENMFVYTAFHSCAHR